MTKYANHLESHVGESLEPLKARDGMETGAEKEEAPETGETLEYIRERMDEIKAPSAKQCLESTLEGIGRVLARLDELCDNLEKSGRVDSETIERDLSFINELLVTEQGWAIFLCLWLDNLRGWLQSRIPRQQFAFVPGMPKTPGSATSSLYALTFCHG